MSDVDVGRLVLEVESVADNSTKGLDALTTSLSKLQSATKGGLGLNTVITQLTKLSKTVDSISNSTGHKLTSLAKGLNSLANVDSVKISGTSVKNIKALINGIKSIGNSDAKKLTEFGEAGKSLSNLGNVKISTTVVKELTKLAALAKSIQNTDFTKLNSMTKALIPIQNINGKVSLPSAKTVSAKASRQSLRDVIIGQASNFVAKFDLVKSYVNRTKDIFGGFITESTKYVEDLNLFTAALGGYAKEAKQYADVVSEALGIDPAMWMRSQGIFQTLAEGFGVASDRAFIMSKNLTQLGYDLSSFFNLSIEDSMTKLESGLAGELEPLRRLGFDLSVARLQQEAYNLGIDESVQKMTQAEKAQLRYYTIMTQVTTAQGDMARTIEAPANQIRIFQAQLTMCARAIGDIFIPALNAILPYAIAVLKVMRLVAEGIANIFGYKLPKIDYSKMTKSLSTSIGDVNTGLDDADKATGAVGDNLGDAVKKAKELKNAVLGIDELNIIAQPDDTTGGRYTKSKNAKTGVGGVGGDFDFPLPQYDFLGDAVSSKVDKIVDKLKGLLKHVDLLKVTLGVIATIFAGLKISKFIDNLAKLGYISKTLTGKEKLGSLAGIMMAVGSAISYAYGMFDMARNGANWKNVIMVIGGIAGVMAGLYLAIKPYDQLKAATISNIAGLGMSIFTLWTALKDIGKNGMTPANLATQIGASVIAFMTLDKLMGQVKNKAAKLVSPMAGLAMSTSLIMTSFMDIQRTGPNLTNVMGLIAGGIGAITSAIKLMKVAQETAFGGMGLAISLVAAAIGGIVLAYSAYQKSIEEAGKKAYESTDDFKILSDSIERSKEASKRAEEALGHLKDGIKNIQDSAVKYAFAQDLIDQIYKINDNANASNYELNVMKRRVEMLNDLQLGDLKLNIDETTGRIVQTREQVQKLIEDLKRKAYNEAVSQLVIQSYKDQIQSAKDYHDALVRQADAQERLDYWFQKFKESKYNSKEWEEAKNGIEQANEALNNANDSLEKSSELYKNATGAIEVYTDKYKLSGEKIDDTNDFINGSVDNLTKDVSEKGKSLTDIVEGIANSCMDGIKMGISNNKPVVEDAMSSVAQGMCNPIGTPLQISFEQLTQRGMDMIQQKIDYNAPAAIDATKRYSNGIVDTYENTVTAGILKQDTQDAFGGVDSGIRSREGVAISTSGEIGSNILNSFANRASYQNFFNIAQNIPRGIIDGIKNKILAIADMGCTIGATLAGAFTGKVEINSPSRLFKRYGSYVVQGLNLGISGEMESSTSLVKEWAGDVSDAFRVDTSRVATNFNRDFTASVATNHTVKTDGFESGMETFYLNYIEPKLTSIENHTKRQADKSEKTIVNVGSKTVTDVVEEQRKADGYKFVS